MAIPKAPKGSSLSSRIKNAVTDGETVFVGEDVGGGLVDTDFTTDVSITKTSPEINLIDSGTVDRNFEIKASSGDFSITERTDADGFVNTLLNVNSNNQLNLNLATSTLSRITFGSPRIDFNTRDAVTGLSGGDEAVNLNTDVTLTGGFQFVEQADHSFTSVTGRGELWLNSADNALMFTDESGTDYNLLTSSTVIIQDAILCPGWAFTRVSATSIISVENVDLTSLFSVGRRLKITDTTDKLGVISSSSYGTGTTVNLTMEGGDTIVADPTEVCLTSSTTSWVPIPSANNPFSGSINDICTGTIGVTQWWVAVGASGQFGVSSDGGASWTLLTTTTAEELNCCVYDETNEEFWAGGNAGVLVSTTNCTSVTEDTTSIPALTGTSTYNISGISHSESENTIVLIYQSSTTINTSAYSLAGAAWTIGNSTGFLSPSKKALAHEATSSGTLGAVNMLRAGSTVTRKAAAYNSTFSTGINTVIQAKSQYYFHDGVGDVQIYGGTSGTIQGIAEWTGDDTTTFSQPINDFAYSSTLSRLVCVGDVSSMGYLDKVNKTNANAWTTVGNGFGASENINAVDRNDSDGYFVAVGSNAVICRSTNGIS